ncbi:MAG: hypothetical protein R3B06_19680 [Kofleriaceae bacterium]
MILDADDPFAVLGVAVTSTPREIEREAQKLLGMLELGFADAASYPGPGGPRPRTADAVRAAAATLRDPRRRLAAELTAGAPTAASTPAAPPTTPRLAWPGALARTGWGPRR